MDKLPQLKQLITAKYANVIRMSQKGYALRGYQLIVKAMEAVSFVENYTLDDYMSTTIVDFYLRKLSEI